MNAIAARWLGLVALLALGTQLWPQMVEPAAIIPASLLILLFYVLLRPLLLTLLLPLNMLLCGLLTPLGDALFLIWAAAWIPGFTLSFWQAVAMAIGLSIIYWPYAKYRQTKLMKN